MIKFTKAILLAALLISAPMSAAQADNDIGCGIGTEIWKGKSGIPFKLMASWTNGALFSSISVTFGLVNCGDPNSTITASAQTRHFAASSLDNLARDVALGGGENLDTLATLLEIETADRAAFARLAQTNFVALFPSDRVTSNEMLTTLSALMSRDEQLAIYVRS